MRIGLAVSDPKPLTAGWYLNPAAGSDQYWDGGKWLDVPKPSSSNNPAISGEHPQTSNLSIVALIFAFVIPIVGMILGFSARKEIEQSNGQKSGSGLATASIWLGALGTLGILLIIILIAVSTNSNSLDVFDPSACDPAIAELFGYTKGSKCNP